MNSIREVDRSIVVLYDIVGYSTRGAVTQGELVSKFINKVDEELSEIDELNPNAFSTGDGAVVSIGSDCRIDRENTQSFIEFAIQCAIELNESGLELTTAINYAERDQIVPLDESTYIHGDHIQTGDTINIAARLLNFCSAGEIIISSSVFERLLRKWDLCITRDELSKPITDEERYVFHENSEIIAKHNRRVKTYTYMPKSEKERKYLYTPDNPSHQYKKYQYFPSINPNIIEQFKQHNLETELERVISEKFNSMIDLNQWGAFISQRRVLDLLMTVRYDPDDTVYVLSREDRPDNFWNQPLKNQYVDYLKNVAETHNGNINQSRIRIYNEPEAAKWLPDDDIRRSLEPLHEQDTYFSYPANALSKYDELDKLIFGFTASKKYKYAIIPIPSPEINKIDGSRLPGLADIGERVQYHDGESVFKNVPMKGIITINDNYVSKLINQMEELLDDPGITHIK